MKARLHNQTVEAWRNVDDGEPIPSWMNDVACWLNGGRFAVETRAGTRIAELGDWVLLREDGLAWVMNDDAFQWLYRNTPQP